MVLRRLYRMARHDSNENFMGRRDFLKIAAGGILAEETGREIQGKGDATTVLDPFTPHQVGETANKINIDVSYGDEKEAVDNHTAAEGHGTPATNGGYQTPSSADLEQYTDILDDASEEELEGMIQYVEQQSGTDLTTSEISDELEMYDDGNKVGLEQDALDRAYEGSGQEAPNAEDLAITVRENGKLVQDFNQTEYESIVDLAEEN